MERLSSIGQNAVAITDHGNLYAGVSIYSLCKEKGIKYIHGCEMYICDDTSFKDKTAVNYHLIVLCKNEQGRINLNKLVSKSNLKSNFYRKPRIDFGMLKEHKEGLIICSACIAGEISSALLRKDRQKAEEIALRYREEFGSDYYIEIQSHNDFEQTELNKELVSLAGSLGIEVVVTTDAHYIEQKDACYQSEFAFGGTYKESGESYVDCYIQSEEEVRQKISYLPQEVIDRAIENTHVIADKCSVELPLSAPIMPKITTPASFKTNEEWLRHICKEGCKQKLGFDIDTLEDTAAFSKRYTKEQREVYRKRYEYEFDALRRMGFLDYILLVYSYANVGKRRGKGRGSGGGSIVNYFANITDIDPIEHGLFFERFVDVSALGALERGEITAKELKIPDKLLSLYTVMYIENMREPVLAGCVSCVQQP